VAQSSGGPGLLVGSPTSRSLERYDATTHARLATIPDLIAQPHEIAWDPIRRRAYVTHTYRAGAYGGANPKAHEITAIDVDDMTIIGVIDTAPYYAPHDVAVDQHTGLIYAGVERHGLTNGVVIIDPSTLSVVANVPLEAANAHWITLAPDGGTLYVTHKEAPQVSFVDTRTHAARVVALPGGAEEIDVSADGRWIYLVTPRFGSDADLAELLAADPGRPVSRVVKIDAQTGEVVAAVGFDHYNVGLHVSMDNTVLVTSRKVVDAQPAPGGPARPGGLLHVVDGEEMTLTGSVVVGPQPLTVRTSADSATAWVSSLGRGLVSVIDLATRTTVAELAGNDSEAVGSTHGLCYLPAG
jgi:DNA-binding beta-propeller fold protein YncE